MTVLVTGGYGFIGHHLVKCLRNKGYRTIVYDKETYACEYVDKENVRTVWSVYGDILDVKKLESVFRIHKFDKVFHLAAESHVDNSIANPNVFANTNVIGTVNILNLAKHYAKHEIHVSTDEVYGDVLKGRSDENFPYNPSSPYSSTKASADHLVKSYIRTFGLPGVISNCCNNYGPNQFPEKLIPLMIANCIEYIMDGKEMYKPADYTEKEVDEFLNSLSSAQFKAIQVFFESLPKLKKDVISTCRKCGTTNTKHLEGINDFFAWG